MGIIWPVGSFLIGMVFENFNYPFVVGRSLGRCDDANNYCNKYNDNIFWNESLSRSIEAPPSLAVFRYDIRSKIC